jgi:hypothetical protein
MVDSLIMILLLTTTSSIFATSVTIDTESAKAVLDALQIRK